MKKIIYLLLASAVTVSFYSCRPEAFKPVGDPVGNIRALTGTWKLTKVLQTDADAQKKGFPFQTLDLTNVFPYSDFTMTFNSNGSTPTTFATIPGAAPKIISLSNGNWIVDNAAAPKNLTLVNGTDTSRVVLGSYPNSVRPTLKLRQERKDAAGKVMIIYDYEFTKQ